MASVRVRVRVYLGCDLSRFARDNAALHWTRGSITVIVRFRVRALGRTRVRG